ncbi:MAG: hypothetical protein DMG65_03865 [Candidatus Angelobacter sp. Gp1-AA117]|nr:MAG: hypothetical protein DMG65_03865 [Candidatus Angelobacter sp. Gp1-AA117]
MKKYLAFVVMGLMATAAFAGTQNTSSNTVSPTLQVSANVQSAVRLTLSTGTAATPHCTVTPLGTPDYSVDFGTVDALAINAPTCGSVFAPTTPGSSNAIYWSDYNLTPVFAGQSTPNNTITAKVTTNFTAADIAVVRDSANSATVPTAVGQFTPLATGAVPDTIVTNAANGQAQTRFIGVAVSPTNGAGTLTGAQTATVTFTLTVQ